MTQRATTMLHDSARLNSEAKVDIVVVNWNAGELLRKCIDSIFRAASAGAIKVNLIVVDNASTDNSIVGLATSSHRIKVLQNSYNAGFAAAASNAVWYCCRKLAARWAAAKCAA